MTWLAPPDVASAVGDDLPGAGSQRAFSAHGLTHGFPLHEGASHRLDEYQPVLALTLLRQRGGRREVLVGVRTEHANRTHPLVVSVPTMRVLPALANLWRGDIIGDGSGRPGDCVGLRYAISGLLSRKLGLAESLELDQIAFEVNSLSAWHGKSVIGEALGEPLTESLTMFNADVLITAGADQFPPMTASYSPLVWADTEDFFPYDSATKCRRAEGRPG